MKTRALTLALLGLFTQNTLALGQTIEEPDFVPSGPTCFDLIDQPDSCLLVGNNVVDPEHPRFNRVDLNGAWTDGLYTLYIYIYSEGNPIFVEMFLVNRPDGFGYFIDSDTFEVVFPDDNSYVGTLTSPTTISWSNNTTWRKIADWCASGRHLGGGSAQAVAGVMMVLAASAGSAHCKQRTAKDGCSRCRARGLNGSAEKP